MSHFQKVSLAFLQPFLSIVRTQDQKDHHPLQSSHRLEVLLFGWHRSKPIDESTKTYLGFGNTNPLFSHYLSKIRFY